MQLLSEIVRNVIVIIIIASFLELLLPQGTLQPLVRFAIGLFVLIAVLNPVMSFLLQDTNHTIEYWNFQADVHDQKEIMQQGKKLNEQIMKSNQQLLQEKMEGQIGAVAMLVPGIEEVETVVSINNQGGMDKIEMIISPQSANPPHEDGRIGVLGLNYQSLSAEEKKKVEAKVRRVVKDLYGFKDEQITIEFIGG
ncbi:MAG: stage III sporulation protein AF [Syntrophomonadaceae bacterium]|nr:stage III sporulation protein AF [Syntrophomonadaceae bacterium]